VGFGRPNRLGSDFCESRPDLQRSGPGAFAIAWKCRMDSGWSYRLNPARMEDRHLPSKARFVSGGPAQHSYQVIDPAYSLTRNRPRKTSKRCGVTCQVASPQIPTKLSPTSTPNAEPPRLCRLHCGKALEAVKKSAPPGRLMFDFPAAPPPALREGSRSCEKISAIGPTNVRLPRGSAACTAGRLSPSRAAPQKKSSRLRRRRYQRLTTQVRQHLPIGASRASLRFCPKRPARMLSRHPTLLVTGAGISIRR